MQENETEKRISDLTARDRQELSEEAARLLQGSAGNVRDMPTTERPIAPGARVTGWALAQSREHLAVATGSNSFVIVPRVQLSSDVPLGRHVRLDVGRNRIQVRTVERERSRGR
jgi:hypothetical protein